MTSTRVLIADTTPARIRMALGGQVQVCAEVASAVEAIRAAKRHKPDVCLLGREICDERFAVVTGITRAAPNAAVVVLVPGADEDELLDAVRAGAVGYVPGILDAARLRRVVRAIEAREAVVPRALVSNLLLELQGGIRDGLTEREARVLAMLRRGYTTATIAERLHIRPVTVRRHISGLVQKLGVAGRSELVSDGWWERN